MYIMAPELISTVYFINPSHQSVYLYAYPLLVTRQQLGNVFTEPWPNNEQAIIEELFSMRSVSYQRRDCD
jgi:hypothetical protein